MSAPSVARATLRIGTRRSPLARAQAAWVGAQLSATGDYAVELVDVTTAGDVSTSAVPDLGGTGVFVSALREALCAGSVDLAVHSLKDLPTEPAPGVLLAAVPLREDPRDALCSSAGFTLAELPRGSTVGTGSPRRTAQLRALGLGLDVVPIRGNVDTRLDKTARGDVDAVVVARAGLARLGRLDAVSEVLDPLQMLPAPGQGALAVECRAEDGETLRLAAALDDAPTRACVTAERALLSALAAGCTAPVGALADVADDEIYLRGVVAAIDGTVALRHSVTGPASDPRELALRLAQLMYDDGAAVLVGADA
ncbi:MAG: hydroxymethylbilane synthase [Mycobacteriales bacterium]|nr:hydroxymethylbilane synthase [Frankia sp.]